MTLYIASDHAGYALKESIKTALKARKTAVEDLGTNSEESVDYPDYAAKLAGKVSQNPKNRGILVCGTGIGMSIAANKVPGVRAAMIYDDFSAKAAAEHNAANVACFGGRTQKPADAARWVRRWLDTPFEGGRHQRRVDKIAKIEKTGTC